MDNELHDLSSLKSILCAAAPISGEILQQISAKHKCEVKLGYGLTECYLATQVKSCDLSTHFNKYDSVGKPTEFTEMKVSCHIIYK